MAAVQDSRLVRRIMLRNYKSIAACDVRPGNLTFLVGPNGAGKSNFLDALRFVADSLRSSLDHALRERGSINEVRRRSGGHPNHFGIRLDLLLPNGRGHYAFTVAARPRGAWVVQREDCWVKLDARVRGSYTAGYRVEEGRVVESTLSPPPAATKDRLYLVNASGTPDLRPVYDALSSMGFYNFNPDLVRDLQSPDPGDLLKRDGANLASVLSALESRAPEAKKRVEEYLARVVPGVLGVRRKAIGPKETLEFRQDIKGARHPWRFAAGNMSDGTLRALGVLVALFQWGGDDEPRLRRLIGIEEPEVALHPAAAGILTDALRDGSEATQVLVTSHSPDLLDEETIPDESILAVVAEHGETKVARPDAAGRTVLRDRLYTAGELLRMDQLHPDLGAVPRGPDELDLFPDAIQE